MGACPHTAEGSCRKTLDPKCTDVKPVYFRIDEWGSLVEEASTDNVRDIRKSLWYG